MPKAPKSSSRPQTKGCTPTPTGIRRFFFKLELLGKRRAELMYDYSNLDPVVSTPPPLEKAAPPEPVQSFRKKDPSPPPAQPTRPVEPWPQAERVALINEDHTEDAVVITAFDDIPFCCHEDLITMSRAQLIDVALSLNAKLPTVMAIDIDDGLPTSFIRGSIERIVGLRRDVPKAPKALRLLADAACDKEFDMRAQMDKTPPTSPLASRSRSHAQLTSLVSPRLARLVEENEDELDVDVADRHLKKRKLSFDGPGSESELSIDSDDIGPVHTPTPLPRLLRSRSHYMASTASPVVSRVLRSQSQKLDKTTTTTIDTAFINNKRPAYRYKSKARRTSVGAGYDQVKPSPKPIGVPRRTGRLKPISGHRPLVPPTRSAGPGSAIADTFSSNEDLGIPSTVVGAKRKRNVGRSEAETQMTSAVGRMNMGWSRESDNMDID